MKISKRHRIGIHQVTRFHLIWRFLNCNFVKKKPGFMSHVLAPNIIYASYDATHLRQSFKIYVWITFVSL